MSKTEPKTPQEIFDYKCHWKSDCYAAVVDQDFDVWAKDWCRKNLERHQWSFERYANPDDSHLVLFEKAGAYESFTNDYNFYLAN